VVEAVDLEREREERPAGSDSYALRLTAALEAIGAAHRAQEAPAASTRTSAGEGGIRLGMRAGFEVPGPEVRGRFEGPGRAEVPARLDGPGRATTVAAHSGAAARPAGTAGHAVAAAGGASTRAGRGFGNARAAATTAYAAPALDLASDDEARPEPLTAEEREDMLEPVAQAPAAGRAALHAPATPEAARPPHAPGGPETPDAPGALALAEGPEAPAALEAPEAPEAGAGLAAPDAAEPAQAAPKRTRSRSAKARPVAETAEPTRRARSRPKANAAESADAAHPADGASAAPRAAGAGAADAADGAGAAASVLRRPRFGKTDASDAGPALDDDADGLDFSAYPTVTEFGTPQELREAAVSGGRSTPSSARAAAGAPDAQAQRGVRAFLAALDRLPPIRLPVGPAIPWRIGLPALVALLAVMLVLNRPTAHAETEGVRLPASETYAVQQEAPLFQKNAEAAQTSQTTQPGQTSVVPGSPLTSQAGQPASVGVPDSAPSGGMDFVDIMLKLVAVLALAYGSLSLLKRAGLGGAAPTSASKPGTAGSNVRVVTSLALAPNRSVHVLQVAGGKTLLLGATPNQVNLLADLGEVNLDAPGAEANFLDILTSKLAR
jgi:flagellar biogenesis protein FliO